LLQLLLSLLLCQIALRQCRRGIASAATIVVVVAGVIPNRRFQSHSSKQGIVQDAGFLLQNGGPTGRRGGRGPRPREGHPLGIVRFRDARVGKAVSTQVGVQLDNFGPREIASIERVNELQLRYHVVTQRAAVKQVNVAVFRVVLTRVGGGGGGFCILILLLILVIRVDQRRLFSPLLSQNSLLPLLFGLRIGGGDGGGGGIWFLVDIAVLVVLALDVISWLWWIGKGPNRNRVVRWRGVQGKGWIG